MTVNIRSKLTSYYKIYTPTGFETRQALLGYSCIFTYPSQYAMFGCQSGGLHFIARPTLLGVDSNGVYQTD